MDAKIIHNNSVRGAVDIKLLIPTDRLSILELHKLLLKHTNKMHLIGRNSDTHFGLECYKLQDCNDVQHISSLSVCVCLKQEYKSNYTHTIFSDNNPNTLACCNGIPVVDYLDFRTIRNTPEFNIIVTGDYAGVNRAIEFLSDLTGYTKKQLFLDNIYISDIPTDGEIVDVNIENVHFNEFVDTIYYTVVVNKDGEICKPDKFDNNVAIWNQIKTNEQFVISYAGNRINSSPSIYTCFKKYLNDGRRKYYIFNSSDNCDDINKKFNSRYPNITVDTLTVRS